MNKRWTEAGVDHSGQDITAGWKMQADAPYLERHNQVAGKGHRNICEVSSRLGEGGKKKRQSDNSAVISGEARKG